MREVATVSGYEIAIGCDRISNMGKIVVSQSHTRASLSRFPPKVKCVNNMGFFKKCDILDDKHFLCLGTIILNPSWVGE